MCVLGGTFLNSPTPDLRSELGRGPDSSQALARPQTPEPPAYLLGWGRRGLCTIAIGQGVLGRTRGFFFPQLQTHFSKWSRLPLLLSWASRAGAKLARPGFPDAWPSEPSLRSSGFKGPCLRSFGDQLMGLPLAPRVWASWPLSLLSSVSECLPRPLPFLLGLTFCVPWSRDRSASPFLTLFSILWSSLHP